MRSVRGGRRGSDAVNAGFPRPVPAGQLGYFTTAQAREAGLHPVRLAQLHRHPGPRWTSLDQCLEIGDFGRDGFRLRVRALCDLHALAAYQPPPPPAHRRRCSIEPDFAHSRRQTMNAKSQSPPSHYASSAVRMSVTRVRASTPTATSAAVTASQSLLSDTPP